MKIDIKFPFGGELHMERPPMSDARFDRLFWLAMAAVCAVTMYKCWAILFS